MRLPAWPIRRVLWSLGYMIICTALCITWGVDVPDTCYLSQTQHSKLLEAILYMRLDDEVVSQVIYIMSNSLAIAYIMWSLMFNIRLLPALLLLLIISGVISAFLSNSIMQCVDSYRMDLCDPARSACIGTDLFRYVFDRSFTVVFLVMVPALSMAGLISYCTRSKV